MPVHNEDIARIFDELADLLEIENANPFRVRAYRNAARSVRSLGRELRDMVTAGADLTALPGIGKDLAAKIVEIVATGHAVALERLHREIPASLEDLLHLPGLGPKRVRTLYEELQVKDLTDLRRVVTAGKLKQLPGFGPKLERQLQAAVAHPEKGTEERRFLLSQAQEYAMPLIAWLRAARGVGQVAVAGSFRRRRETVGDLDILVTAQDHLAVIARFADYDEVAEVMARGETRASVRLHCGLQVDLRVVDEGNIGAALHYFTGSKAHNIAVRHLAQQRGLKINEYGVFKGARRIAGADERSVFAAVGLPWIPPELRENTGEIEAARHGALPILVTRDDLKGDLHAHTDMSDGHADMRSLALAAKASGLAYLAITDHSRHLGITHGLDETRLRQQMAHIDRLNDELDGITLLKGIEVDILEDGRLALPDSVLHELDVVIGAIHDRFQLPATKQTERILRAMDHPCFTLLAHPSGRLLNERPPYDVEMERIVRHAHQRGCFLELNAQPQRLDLTDIYCRLARSEGVLVSIDSDAHGINDFQLLGGGVDQARRGGLEAADVLNTRPLKELRRLLRQTRL